MTRIEKPGRRADLRLDPREPQLLEELRAAWGIADGKPLIVIGKLSEHLTRLNVSLFFLVGLEHPESGLGLAYPAPMETEPVRAYVGANNAGDLRDGQWAIAELQLSSLEEREKHGNDYECRVRRETLRLLSDIPSEWNIRVMGPKAAPQITTAAREAISAHIQDEQARAAKAIAAAENRKIHAVAYIENEIARTEARKTAAERELETVSESIRDEQRRLQDIHQQALRETQLMEERFRHLASLLEAKGRRLVALSLVDEDDLASLLPQSEAADARVGHDFRGDLGGDFARLAPFIQARLRKKGKLFSLAQLRDFLALARTHDLIILAGDSGAGKTSLVRDVAESIGGKCTVIPVKPNWTGPEDLLGYYNPIEGRYQPTKFLLALLAAAREPDVPHFICLDEMNLARVEHYFADFLSLLETRRECPVIHLYAADEERHAVVENGLFLAIEAEVRARAGFPETATLEDLLKDEQANRLLHQLGGFRDSVLLHHGRLRRAIGAVTGTPTSIRFPPNVRIVGAINVDETTHYLSPKVLDRAHVLRFRNPVLTDWEALEAEVETFDLDLDLPVRLSARDDLGVRGDYPAFDRTDANSAFLAGLARRQLDPLGVEFGLRAIRQALGYIREAEIAGIREMAALNNVALHKIQPKLMLDTARIGSDGRKRIDILKALRDELSSRLAGLATGACAESSVEALDHLIGAAEGNNGIANYWLR